MIFLFLLNCSNIKPLKVDINLIATEDLRALPVKIEKIENPIEDSVENNVEYIVEELVINEQEADEGIFLEFEKEEQDFEKLMGGTLDLYDPFNVHLICYFVKEKRHITFFKNILEREYGIYHKDMFGRTLLHFIFFFNNVEALQALYEKIGEKILTLNERENFPKPEAFAKEEMLNLFKSLCSN